jgi:hypothetical protein
MDRRQFLTRAGSAIGALVVAGGAARLLVWDQLRDAYHDLGRKLDPEYDLHRAIADIRSHFRYLDFDQTIAEEYVREYFEKRGPVWEREHRDFHTRFLLSTDFFPEADESRKLEYTGYYDPSAWCANPFARKVPV